MANNIVDDYLEYLNEFNPTMAADMLKEPGQKAVKATINAQMKKFETAAIHKALPDKLMKSKLFKKYGFKMEDAFLNNLNLILIFDAIGKSFELGQAIIIDAERKCGTFDTSPGHDLCVAQEKIKSNTLKLKALTKLKSECRLSKNPQKCLAKIDSDINKCKRQIMYNRSIVSRMKSDVKPVNENAIVNGVVGGVKTIGGLVVGIFAYDVLNNALSKAFNVIKMSYDENTRKCRKEKGPDNAMCIATLKLEAHMKQRKVLMDALKQCSSLKDGKNDKCKVAISKKLENVNRGIKIEQYNLQYFRKEKFIK